MNCRAQHKAEIFHVIKARRGEIMPRKWSEVRVDDEYPYIYVAKTKNKRPKRLPLPGLAILALRQLPSYRTHEYLFPAKPNVRFKGDFKKPHAWDLGKRFRRACKNAGITDLRIHDLRHFATTMLFIEGVPDAIIRKMTGHRSEELERYKHLSASFKQQSVELIAGRLTDQLATKRATPSKNTNAPRKPKGVSAPFTAFNGGADGTRTRALRRLCAFFAHSSSHLQPPKSAAPHLWGFCGDCLPRLIPPPRASARRWSERTGRWS